MDDWIFYLIKFLKKFSQIKTLKMTESLRIKPTSRPRSGGNIYKTSHHDHIDVHHHDLHNYDTHDSCDPCATGNAYGGIVAVVVLIIIILIVLFIIFRQRTATAPVATVDCKTNTPINVAVTSPSNKTVTVTWTAVTPNIAGNAIEYTVFVSPIENFGTTDVGVQQIKTPNTTATFGGVNFTPAYVKLIATEKDCEPSELSEQKSVVVECTVVIPNSGIGFQVTKIATDITEGEFTHAEGAKSYQLEIWRSEAVGPNINERHIFFGEENIPVPDGTTAGSLIQFDFDPVLDVSGGEEYHIILHAINECGKSNRSDQVFAL